jgi:hypothetical protein
LYVPRKPTLFRHDGFLFCFYSNELHPLEPAHVHVWNVEREAKVWLRPEVSVADSFDLDAKKLRRLVSVIEARRDVIERAWHDHFA